MKNFDGLTKRAASYPETGFLFIVGHGRDGSTLLQHLLNQSDSVLIRGENLIGLQTASLVGTHSVQAPKYAYNMTGAAKDLTTASHPWFGFEGINGDVVKSIGRDLIVNQVIRPQPGHRLVGFKEIRWFDLPNTFLGIRAVFPNSKFLFLERSVEEMGASGWWKSLSKARETLEYRQQLARQMLHELGREGQLVKYSRLKELSLRTELEDFLETKFNKRKWGQCLENVLSHNAGMPPWNFLQGDGSSLTPFTQ